MRGKVGSRGKVKEIAKWEVKNNGECIVLYSREESKINEEASKQTNKQTNQHTNKS